MFNLVSKLLNFFPNVFHVLYGANSKIKIEEVSQNKSIKICERNNINHHILIFFFQKAVC